jgi:hypothetical protein
MIYICMPNGLNLCTPTQGIVQGEQCTWIILYTCIHLYVVYILKCITLLRIVYFDVADQYIFSRVLRFASSFV